MIARIRETLAFLLDDWQTTVPVALFVGGAVLMVQLFALSYQAHQAEQAEQRAELRELLVCGFFGEPVGCQADIVADLKAETPAIDRVARKLDCALFSEPADCRDRLRPQPVSTR